MRYLIDRKGSDNTIFVNRYQSFEEMLPDNPDACEQSLRFLDSLGFISTIFHGAHIGECVAASITILPKGLRFFDNEVIEKKAIIKQSIENKKERDRKHWHDFSIGLLFIILTALIGYFVTYIFKPADSPLSNELQQIGYTQSEQTPADNPPNFPVESQKFQQTSTPTLSISPTVTPTPAPIPQ